MMIDSELKPNNNNDLNFDSLNAAIKSDNIELEWYLFKLCYNEQILYYFIKIINL